MELRHLRYFVAVAEHLHFGRAAEALHTAQPSLSQQIRQLEGELAVTLFERTNHRVRLTAAGDAFLIDARATLAHVAASTERVRAAGKGRPKLEIAFMSGAMLTVLPQAIRAFRNEHPAVAVRLATLSSREIVDAVRLRRAHVGIIPAAVDAADLVATPVARQRLRVLIPADHPLAAATRIRVDDLRGETLILYARALSHALSERTLAIFRDRGFEPAEILEAAETETIIGLVASGCGIALVPASPRALHVGGIVSRRLDAAESEITAYAYRHAEETSPLVEAFIESARGVFGKRVVDLHRDRNHVSNEMQQVLDQEALSVS